MKILVLGNGFDVDHDLPTSYYNFMNFCNKVLNKFDSPTYVDLKDLTMIQLSYMEELEYNEDFRKRFIALLKENCLFRHFNRQIEKRGTNWIDLETEIKSVINEFKTVEQEFKNSNQTRYNATAEHRIHDVIESLGLKHIDSGKLNEVSLAEIHSTLCKALNDFSLALELYISHFVNNTPIQGVSPNIIDFDANKVITFNYSNTYQRIYGGVHWNEQVHYIHGCATENFSENSNIILGITSPCDGSAKNSSYVEFEKYYQRITKKTGSDYKSWLQENTKEDESIEIAFFGHSLDSSDSDIITDLISCDKTSITIYYYNDKSYQQIVSNLIDIIGKNNLIAQVSGKKPKIRFVPQAQHQYDNSGGVEITRDIRFLYQAHAQKSINIEELLSKVKSMYNTQDLTYFHSQRKAISLYEALCSYDIYEFDEKTYLSICKRISFEEKLGRPLMYKHSDWSNYSEAFGEEECSPYTKRLIDKINEYNRVRYEKKQNENPYIALVKITDVEEMKTYLCEILTEDNPTQQYWEHLNEIIRIAGKNDVLDKAVRGIELSKLTIPVRFKFKYFSDLYFEHGYDLYMIERYEEERKRNPDID